MSALSVAEPANFAAAEAVEKDMHGNRNSRAANEMMATSPDAKETLNVGKVILVGSEDETVLEKRLRAAGCEVVTVKDGKTAFERARRESFDGAVLVSRGSLINVTETIFNLRDINPSMEIIVVLDRGGKKPNRYLRQLLNHPIAGMEVLTRHQLQDRLKRGRARRLMVGRASMTG